MHSLKFLKGQPTTSYIIISKPVRGQCLRQQIILDGLQTFKRAEKTYFDTCFTVLSEPTLYTFSLNIRIIEVLLPPKVANIFIEISVCIKEWIKWSYGDLDCIGLYVKMAICCPQGHWSLCVFEENVFAQPVWRKGEIWEWARLHHHLEEIWEYQIIKMANASNQLLISTLDIWWHYLCLS